jgi:hypothetical protein
MSRTTTFATFPALPGRLWTTHWAQTFEAGDLRKGTRRQHHAPRIIAYEVLSTDPLAIQVHDGLDQAREDDAGLLAPFLDVPLHCLSGRTLLPADRIVEFEEVRRRQLRDFSVEELRVDFQGTVAVDKREYAVIREWAAYRCRRGGNSLVSTTHETRWLVDPTTGLLFRQKGQMLAFGLGPQATPASLSTYCEHVLTLHTMVHAPA